MTLPVMRVSILTVFTTDLYFVHVHHIIRNNSNTMHTPERSMLKKRLLRGTVHYTIRDI